MEQRTQEGPWIPAPHGDSDLMYICNSSKSLWKRMNCISSFQQSV